MSLGHLAVLAASLAAASSAPSEELRTRKPRFDLRATPRMSFSPTTVFFTAELSGGDDVEEFYCPELEWDWGDGGKSIHESDCPPFELGVKIERRFTAEHDFRRAGQYNIRVAMRRTGRLVALASVRVLVRPGIGR
jgi:hypothetical protein